MKWTNKLQLPEPYYQAVVRESHVVDGEMSVTQLLMPPQMFQLLRRHDDELEADVSDWNYVTAFMGTSIHTALAANAGKNSISETLMTMEVEGWKISGTPDYVEKGVLTDYKLASVWSVILGGKEDWQNQLQIYAYLLRKNGIEVKKARNVMWFRDWMQSRAKKESDYPQYGVRIVELDKLWDEDFAKAFISRRVKLHQEAQGLNDANLLPCDDKERWVRGEKWAVMKKGRKSAVALCRTAGEAAGKAADHGAGYRVEHRAGVAVRCADWCGAREHCHQAAGER